MSEDLTNDYSEEDEVASSDENEDIADDFDDDRFHDGTEKYMPDLLSHAELSDEVLERMTSQFARVFEKRYPASGLRFFAGSLTNALNQSIFNLENPRPLVLYIRRDDRTFDNIFCGKFFHHKNIVDILNNEFLVWPWDRTDINNYRKFLKLLIETFGSGVASKIDSHSETAFPLLVCLSGANNRYSILEPEIDNQVHDEEGMYSALCLIQDNFHPDGTTPNEISINGWFIPNSHRIAIPRGSDQFISILRNLNMEERKITSIEKIENMLWSVQYSSEWKRYENRNGRSPKDKELFYCCPFSVARDILYYGFFSDTTPSIRVKRQEDRFYAKCKQSDASKRERSAILICRILLDEADPVLRRNEQILPEYLAIYTE